MRRHPDGAGPGSSSSSWPVSHLSRKARHGLLFAALGVIAVLGVARWLRPDPRGFGTHQQLGLFPCHFRAITGVGCPSCGMTTAFAWFVRGRFDASWGANPAGCLLAGLCVGLVPWMLLGAVTGRTWGVRSIDAVFLRGTLVVATVSFLVWAVRLFL